MILSRQLAKAPNYVRAFGWVNGLRLLRQIERRLPFQSTKLRSYDVPRAKAPIWLRETKSDHATFWQCMVARHYDISGFPHTQRLLDTYTASVSVGKRPLIIDCGGNIGLSAIWFALNFPKSQILVLEPEERNFDLLTRNVAPYADTIQPLRGAVWARPEHLQIANPQSGAAAFQVQAFSAADREKLRAFTIEELLAISGCNEALIIKLDIEGSQKVLFEENTGWVERANLIILELDDWQYPWAGTSRSFFRCISQYPFEYLIGGEHIFCFQDLKQE